MNKLYSVYGLFVGNECFYVGCTGQKNPNERLWQHLTDARRGKTECPVQERLREFLHSGVSPRLEVFETHAVYEEAIARERLLTFYIRDYAGVDLANEMAGNRHSNKMCLRQKISIHSVEKQSNNTSGVRGVSWHKRYKTWRAWITIDGKNINLGAFARKEDAIAARKAAERDFWATMKQSKETNV